MSEPVFTVRGYNTTVYHWRSEPDLRAAMAPLLAGGTNTLIVDIGFRQDSITASRVEIEDGEFSSLGILEEVVRVVRDMGFSVWIKPVLFTGGSGLPGTDAYQWSAIMPGDPQAWFDSYGEALRTVLARVQPYGIDALLLGNELTRVATTDAFADFWRAMIADVRAVFDGAVGYNATAYSRPAGLPEEFVDTVFLDALDFIGLSSYPQLYTTRTPTREEMEAGWRSSVNGGIDIVEALRAFMSAHPDLKVAFTELGSPAADGGNWTNVLAGYFAGHPLMLTRDLDEQALYFDVAMQTLSREFGDRLLGVFPFRWGSTTQFGHEDVAPSREIYTWDLQGKPAADVIAGWYRGERSADGVHVSGTAGADHTGGGFYDDTVRGGRGDDRLTGGPGDDRLHGDGMPAPQTTTVVLEIGASGALLDGVAPRVEVRADGVLLGVIDVPETVTYFVGTQAWNGPTTYRFAVPGGVPVDDLRLVPLNHEGRGAQENRNLYLQSVTLDGIVLSPVGEMFGVDGRLLGSGQALYASGHLALSADAYNGRVVQLVHDNDVLDGGAGQDTAVFAGPRSAYTVASRGGAFEVVDRLGSDGHDRLVDIEFLAFLDQTVALQSPPRTAAPAYASSPGFLFDPVHYLLANPELVRSVSVDAAWAHYTATGAAEGRLPNAWFDAAWYAQRWTDLTPFRTDPATLFAHYNLYGVWEGRAAGPRFAGFDGARYLADNPDVAAYVDAYLDDFLGSRTNGAIAHYVMYGAAEQRTAWNLSGARIDLGYEV